MTEYYVDSRKTADGNGSVKKPWNNVNRHVRQLTPGDTMYLRGGTTKAEAQSYSELVRIKASNGCLNGSSGSEITIKNYPGEYVVFDNSTDADIFQVERSYWIIDGTETDNSGDYYFKIDKMTTLQSACQVVADNVTLRYLEVTGGKYNLVDIDDSNNILIEYCKIHTTDWRPAKDTHGIVVRGFSDHGIIRYCEIFDCRGDCIEVFHDRVVDNQEERKTGWEVYGCDLYCTPAGQGGCELAIGFKGGESWRVHDNKMHGFRDVDGSLGGTGSDGQCIVVGGGGENCEFFNNEFYDFSGAVIRVDKAGVVFRHNVIRDPVYEASIGEKTILYVTRPGECQVYNNTFVGNRGPGTNAMRFLANSKAWIKNNIFKDTGAIQDDGATRLDYEHNCWCNCSQTLSGTNDVTGDPLFVNEAGGDCRLEATSPCIDAGVDLGYPYRGSHPDMGAYEYGDGAPPVGIVPVPTDVERILNELEAKLRELRELVLSN